MFSRGPNLTSSNNICTTRTTQSQTKQVHTATAHVQTYTVSTRHACYQLASSEAMITMRAKRRLQATLPKGLIIKNEVIRAEGKCQQILRGELRTECLQQCSCLYSTVEDVNDYYSLRSTSRRTTPLRCFREFTFPASGEISHSTLDLQP